MLNESPIRILIVDDREENLIALEAALSNSGYEIAKAYSGPEALLLAQSQDFALIILDVQMPIMDGFETARRLRNEPRSKSTPIIFATAIHRSDEYAQMGYLAGAVDYLYKPIDLNILRAKVAVFADLYRMNQEIRKQAELLKETAVKARENELLKDAIKARDEYLSIVSHELKTPMTPLSLQLQSFRHLLEQGSLNQVAPDRLKRMLDTSYQQVERLTALIDDLLDLSRITAGRLSLSPEDTDLKLIVESVLEAFHEEITKSGAGVELFSPPQVLGHWDRARLEQVVINLLSNALKYGPRKPIHIRLSHAPEKARLEVRDFGIGIDPHDQLRIFQRFERAVSSDNYGGLGLGLYITSEIVGLHRGKIWVESVPGSGSNFIVELPLRA